MGEAPDAKVRNALTDKGEKWINITGRGMKNDQLTKSRGHVCEIMVRDELTTPWID